MYPKIGLAVDPEVIRRKGCTALVVCESFKFFIISCITKKFYDFIYYHPHVDVKQLEYKLCLNAGIIKSKYNIAFSDCFLLALSEHDNTTVLFKMLKMG